MKKKINKLIKSILKKSNLFFLGIFLSASVVSIMESIRVSPSAGYVAFIIAFALSAMASMIVQCVYGIRSKNRFYHSGDLFFPTMMFIFKSLASLYYANLSRGGMLIFLTINLIVIIVPILTPYVAYRFYGIKYKLEWDNDDFG